MRGCASWGKAVILGFTVVCSDRVGKDAVEGLRKGLEAIHGYLGKGIRRQEWMPRKGKPAAS